MPRKELTDKQAAFCREYVVDFNAKQAAIRAGYSEKTAAPAASRLLTNVNVSTYLSDLMAKATNRAEVTVGRVLAELSNIAFLDPCDFLNDDGTLRKISEIPEHARRAIGGMDIKEILLGSSGDPLATVAKLKIWDKNAALDKLGRYLKMFTDKIEHEHTGDFNFNMVVHKSND